MNKLENFSLKTGVKTFVIAEIGINHNGDLELAKKLIDSAARAGANAVKFQTYKTETRTTINSPIYDILKKCELGFDNFRELKEYSEAKNVIFFSTPFDEESVDYLESIDVPFYKIASFDVANLPLLEKIAKTKKPIIVSIGMSNLEEIKNAISLLEKFGSQVALLHCISAYPTPEEESNLSVIGTLKKMFPNNIIGLSDHTNGIFVPQLSVVMGAQIIEKHFKIDDKMDCPDSVVSIDEGQLKEFVDSLGRIDNILGNNEIQITEIEKQLLWLKRSKK